MKSYELKPNYNNLVESLLKDTIGRNQDIRAFSEILNSVTDSCSILLDGKWGSGKTFFVKQTKMFIDSQNDLSKTIKNEHKDKIKNLNVSKIEYQPQVCVYYDAWTSDNDSDPILSLVYSIISEIDTDFPFSKDDGVLKKAAAVLELFTDKNWTGLIERFKGDNPLDEIRKSKDVENTIKDFFDMLLAERGNRLIVFVDELDRCKPDYAVKFLERIKHYFLNDKITFVFSINTQELQHTIKCHYGNDFDACRYLDRFFDLRITLPDADKNRFYQSINFKDDYYTYDRVCREVIEEYNFSLREIAKYIKMTKIAAYNPTHDKKKYDFVFSEEKAQLFGLMYIVPIMIGLKMNNLSQYSDFISGKDSSPLIKIINRLYDYSFNDFLAQNETFNEKKTEKVLVSLNDKLEEIYHAIFGTSYTRAYNAVNIGNYSFNGRTKELLLRVISLLSQYSDMNIE